MTETVFGTLWLGTELRAGVNIWGPKFSGIATISWSVISFTVSFGAADEKPATEFLDFGKFQTAFLPAADEICRIKITSGLVREIPPLSGSLTALREFVVRPEELALVTECVMPSTEVQVFKDATTQVRVIGNASNVGMRPVGTGTITSIHVVKLRRLAAPGQPEQVLDLQSQWLFDPAGQRQGVPKQLWGTLNVDDAPPGTAAAGPSADLLPNQLVGMRELRPGDTGLSLTNPPEMDIRKAFAFNIRQNTVGLLLNRLAASQAVIILADLDAVTLPAGSSPADFINQIKTTVNLDSRRERRSLAVAVAAEMGMTGLPDGPLGVLSRDAQALLQFPPMLGELGSIGTGAIPAVPSVDPIPDVEFPEAFKQALLTELAQIEMGDSATGTVEPPAAGEGEQALTSPSATQPAAAARGLSLASLESAETLPTLPARTLSQNGRKLIPGRTIIWAVETTGPGSPVPALRIAGGENMSLRVVALDMFGNLLQDDLTPAAATTLTLRTPAELIITGLSTPAEPPKIFGWRGTTPLLQVAGLRYLAEGATVDVEETGVRAPDSIFRVVPAQKAMRSNVLPDRNSATGARNAAVSTRLPQEVQTLAVIVTLSDALSNPSLGTAIETQASDGSRFRLVPLFVIRESAMEFVLLCRVPPNLRRDAAGRAGFRVQASGGVEQWRIDGVMGIAEPIALVRRNWPAFKLEPAALGRTPGTAPETTVKFVAAEGVAV